MIHDLLKRFDIDIPRPSVLLVDDEPENLAVLEAVLSMNGVEVHQASDAPSALRILKAEPSIGVLISDQRMPGMTGVELLSVVSQSNPEIVRMILTGYTDLEPIVNAVNQGQVFRFLFKPWEASEVMNALEAAFRKFENRSLMPRLLETLLSRRDEIERNIEDFDRLERELRSFLRNEALQRLGSRLGAQEPYSGYVLSEDFAALTRSGDDSGKNAFVGVLPFAQRIAADAQAIWGMDLSIDCQVEGSASFDAPLTRQALFALLENARFASQNEGVALAIKREGDDLRFSVNDSGGTMTDEVVSMAEQPGFSAFAVNGEHEGRGLNIARQIADELNGDFEFRQGARGAEAVLWVEAA